MATADDTTTKIDWIWLREARDLAAKALGSKAGAEAQLLEWMAAGKLPWTCTRWTAPDAADIARMNQILVVAPSPQTVYYNGDPRFMAIGPDMDWEDNSAREASYLPDGASAQGIKVSLTRLRELLPGVEALQQTEPAEQKMEPKDWLAKARKDHPRQRNERHAAYTRRLHTLMREANVTEVWPFGTLRRRLYDK